MTIHLIVLGRRPGLDASPPDVDMDDVEKLVRPTAARLVRRCDTPSELIFHVESVAQTHGLIDVLDIFDHGRSGAQQLGSKILFESDELANSPIENAYLAAHLRPFLSNTAHVRMLGCRTARSAAGRFLLVKLAVLFGGRRVVFGTVDGIETDDFDVAGFETRLERTKLFSSLAAIDGIAPTKKERDRHLDEING